MEQFVSFFDEFFGAAQTFFFFRFRNVVLQASSKRALTFRKKNAEAIQAGTCSCDCSALARPARKWAVFDVCFLCCWLVVHKRTNEDPRSPPR